MKHALFSPSGRSTHAGKAPALAIALLACAMLAPEAQAGTVVYREIFPANPDAPPQPFEINPTGAANVDQLINQGWYGGNTGDNFETSGFNAADQNDGGEGAIGGGAPFGPETTPINSNPQGPWPPSAYAFTSQNGISNLFLYTTEFLIDSQLLEHVSWDSRNNANSTNTSPSAETLIEDKWYDQGSSEAADSHVAVRIDDGVNSWWYISLEGFLHQGENQTWLSNSTDIDVLDWVLFDQGPGDGSTLPGAGGSFTILGDLPAGTVDAIGLFSSRSAGNIRIDNFAVSATVPVPAPLPLLLVGLGGLALARSRRRDA